MYLAAVLPATLIEVVCCCCYALAAEGYLMPRLAMSKNRNAFQSSAGNNRQLERAIKASNDIEKQLKELVANQIIQQANVT